VYRQERVAQTCLLGLRLFRPGHCSDPSEEPSAGADIRFLMSARFAAANPSCASAIVPKSFAARNRRLQKAKSAPACLLVCYLTRLSRWFGLLEVVEGPFIDHKPIFVPENDPLVVRFFVQAKVWLEYEKRIPIQV
jgi:hypothetical protein